MMRQAPESRFPITIVPEDIDELDHVNNAVYLRWVQTVVVAHWERLGSPEWTASHLWVALRHEIHYRSAVEMTDRVSAIVRVVTVKGVRATFTTKFVRTGDLVAHAESDWCCLDVLTRRPKRISADIANRFLGSDGAALA